MPIALPIEIVVDDHALGRTDEAVGRRQKVPGERLRIRINQPRFAVEPESSLGIARSVGLKMIELAGADAGNKHAPDIAPAVGFDVELDDVIGLAVFDLVIEQEPQRGGVATEYDKLHAAVVNERAVRKLVGELKRRMRMTHEHRLGLAQILGSESSC